MELHLIIRLVSVAVVVGLSACSSVTKNRIPAGELTEIRFRDFPSFETQLAPWQYLEANSEQRQPVYLGNTPRDIEIFNRPPAPAVLPKYMKARAEKLLRAVQQKIKLEKIEIEAWPVRDDDGVLTWTAARWREASKGVWNWLERADYEEEFKRMRPEPMLPRAKMLSRNSDFGDVFNDFLEMGLYDKPLFGDCVWTSKKDDQFYGAWLPTAARERLRDHFLDHPTQKNEMACRVLPMPSRLNGVAKVFVLGLSANGIQWPSDIQFADKDEQGVIAKVPHGESVIKNWPAQFSSAYKKNLKTLSDPGEVVFPLSGKRVVFTRRNNAQRDNQLLDLVEFLAERYEEMGIHTRRYDFMWRGIPQANLIAVIPGSLQGRTNRPVLIADHFDTAFAAEVYDDSKTRVSVPGADDNYSATAALLSAAAVLKGSKPKHDIWLVHITGEEFPGDDLGARRIVEWLLKEKQEISGLVLMDMIGYREAGDPVFQINPGDSDESLRIAAIAKQASAVHAPRLQSLIRTRFDRRSYLYNTDGLIFSDAGFPVILLNEHINHLDNLGRSGYHEMSDTSSNIDWDYVVQIVKTGIETAARLAGVTPVRF